MRKAKSGPTVNAKRFYFRDDEKYPRADVTVDGYEFGFTCDSKLTPVIVRDKNVNGNIKAKAYAVAAGLFKTHMMVSQTGGLPVERQPALL